MKYAITAAILAALLLSPSAFAQEEDEYEDDAFNDDENFQLVSSREHLENTGWGVYIINNAKCSLQSTQNEHTLSFSFPSEHFGRLGMTIVPKAAVTISNDNWNFSDVSKFRLTTIVKLNSNTMTENQIFTTKYGENYLESSSADETPLGLKNSSSFGIEYIEYIIDLKNQEDIKFDMKGLNSLVEDYWNCAETLREFALENDPVLKKLQEMYPEYEGTMGSHSADTSSGYTIHGSE